MKNIFEVIKHTMKKTFHQKEKPEKKKENPVNMEILNKGPVKPGLEKSEEDIGKKVFEKTGQLHEGVGQSSTPEPRETPVKTNQGIKNHEPHKKNITQGRKPKVKK